MVGCERSGFGVSIARKDQTMHYEAPDFIEIKMDAEIGAYQNDFDPSRAPGTPSFVVADHRGESSQLTE
jgi:hypothetical protein